jgi:hypothetical protein
MVDADGLLKWAPHNLLTYSEDFNTTWLAINGATVDSSTGYLAPDGNLTADKLFPATTTADCFVYKNASGLVPSGTQNVCSFFAKAGEKTVAYLVDIGGQDPRKCFFNLSTGEATLGIYGSDPFMVDVGNGWWHCGYTRPTNAQFYELGVADSVGSSAVTANGTDGIYIWGAHFYRSDLGGMVNNPDTGNSYVPTTSAVIYSPRRGNHVYNGTSWVNEGLLLESAARTNLLLNSGTLSTQSATVANVANTLSFTGTGTVTLSGVSTAGPLVGTGTGENNRVSLTFTPTAGTLTLTVSGTVTNAQLEAGPTPSSYISTAGATVTRAAETLTVAAANMPAYTTAVSIQMDGRMTYADEGSAFQVRLHQWYLNSTNYIDALVQGVGSDTGNLRFRQSASGEVDNSSNASGSGQYSPGILVPYNIASRHGSTFINGAVDGTALTADTTPVALPDLSATDLKLGYDYMGTLKLFRVWADDIGDTGIAEASA